MICTDISHIQNHLFAWECGFTLSTCFWLFTCLTGAFTQTQCTSDQQKNIKWGTERVHIFSLSFVYVLSAVATVEFIVPAVWIEAQDTGICCNYGAVSLPHLGMPPRNATQPLWDQPCFLPHSPTHWTTQLLPPGLDASLQAPRLGSSVTLKNGFSISSWDEPAQWDPCPLAWNGKGSSIVGQAREEGRKFPPTTTVPTAEHDMPLRAKEKSLGWVGPSCREQQGHLGTFLSLVQTLEWPVSGSGTS